MPLSVRKIADHEVIEVLVRRPYQPYEHLSSAMPLPAARRGPSSIASSKAVAGERNAMLRKLPGPPPTSLKPRGNGRSGLSSKETAAVESPDHEPRPPEDHLLRLAASGGQLETRPAGAGDSQRQPPREPRPLGARQEEERS